MIVRHAHNSVIADISYRYARADGDLITVQARNGSRYAELYDNGMNMENSIMLSFMVPIEVPTVPRRDVATVCDRAFDQEIGAGLSNVVLKVDRPVAITDENGYFMFPSVKLGVYDLTFAGGSLPVGIIPTLEMPRPVDLYFDAGATIDVPFIPARPSPARSSSTSRTPACCRRRPSCASGRV